MTASEHSLQYVQRDSILHRIYPLTKLAWVFVVAIGLFLYRAPRSGAVMFVAVLALALLAGRIPLGTIVASARVIFGLGILLMIFHFFADPGNPVFRIGPLTVTDGGLYEGPIFFFRLSVVVLASFVLIWTTDPRDLMVSLTRSGIPYRYAFAVFLAMRFLPLVQREVDAVRAAHAIRGRASRSTIGHRFRLWQRYMFTVLVNGLRKAEATATALECRAFGAYPDRTYVKTVEFEPLGLTLVLLFILLTAGLIYWEHVS
jgi:energy-coupling factor transport system permease protein